MSKISGNNNWFKNISGINESVFATNDQTITGEKTIESTLLFSDGLGNIGTLTGGSNYLSIDPPGGTGAYIITDGAFSAKNGSVSNPSYVFSGSNSTGMSYEIGASPPGIVFSKSGSEISRLDINGISSSNSLYLAPTKYLNTPGISYTNTTQNTGISKMSTDKQTIVADSTTKLTVEKSQVLVDHIPNPFNYYDFTSDLDTPTSDSYFIDKGSEQLDFNNVSFAGLTPIEFDNRSNVLNFTQTAGVIPPTQYAQMTGSVLDSYQNLANFSISCWINFSSTTVANVICSFSDTSNASTEMRLFTQSGDARFSMRTNGVIQFDLTYTTNINDNNWHHLVAVSGTDRGAELWVDGALRVSSANTSSLTSFTIDSFMIGGNEDSTGKQWGYGGYLSDMALFDRALSTADIGYLCNYFRVGRININSNMPLEIKNLTLTEQATFCVESTSTQSIATATDTIVNGAWGTPSINQGFTSFSAGVLTIATSGVYILSAQLNFANNTTGERGLHVSLNATDRLGYNYSTAVITGGNHLNISWTCSLEVSDTLSLNAYQNSGGNLNIGGTGASTSRFSVVRLF